MKKNNNLKIMTECTLMISLSVVLSLFTIFKMPLGGSITLASMAPIIIISFRRGIRWGCLSGLILSFIQIIQGFHFPPVANAFSLLSIITLDYFIPYISLGLADFFSVKTKNKKFRIISGTISVLIIRLSSAVTSGILIWSEYAPKNVPIFRNSLIYNLTYMIPESILTIFVCLLYLKYFYEKSENT